MSSLIDNNFAQLALILFAFYVIMQIINSDTSAENMENSQEEAPNQTTQAPLQTTFAPYQPTPPAPMSEEFAPAPTMFPSIPTMGPTILPSTPSPMTMPPSETAPPHMAPSIPEMPNYNPQMCPPGSLQTEYNTDSYCQNPNPLQEIGEIGAWSETPVGVNVDQSFGHRGQLSPQELLPPPPSPDIYGDLQPDENLAQNFLQNRWSLGLDVSNSKKHYINDLRGCPDNVAPYITVSPFMQPTSFPTLHRRNIKDVA